MGKIQEIDLSLCSDFNTWLTSNYEQLEDNERIPLERVALEGLKNLISSFRWVLESINSRRGKVFLKPLEYTEAQIDEITSLYRNELKGVLGNQDWSDALINVVERIIRNSSVNTAVKKESLTSNSSETNFGTLVNSLGQNDYVQVHYAEDKIASVDFFDLNKRTSERVIGAGGFSKGYIWSILDRENCVIIFEKKGGPALILRKILKNTDALEQREVGVKHEPEQLEEGIDCLIVDEQKKTQIDRKVVDGDEDISNSLGHGNDNNKDIANWLTKNRKWMISFARSYGIDSYDAEDAVQTVILQGLKTSRNIKNYKAYFGTAIRHTIFRKKKKDRQVEMDSELSLDAIADDMEFSFCDRAMLRHRIDNLPGKERRAVEARLQGKMEREIAEQLSVSEPTVSRLFHSAVRHLEFSPDKNLSICLGSSHNGVFKEVKINDVALKMSKRSFLLFVRLCSQAFLYPGRFFNIKELSEDAYSTLGEISGLFDSVNPGLWDKVVDRSDRHNIRLKVSPQKISIKEDSDKWLIDLFEGRGKSFDFDSTTHAPQST